MHDSNVGGCHFGINATFNKAWERYWWKGMYEDILRKVNKCEICQKQNGIKRIPSELHPVPVPDKIFAQWGMDLIGPLKQSQSGNQYIVVFTEYLTKWTEAKSIPDKSALTIFTAIGEHIISRFGAPKKIISDQGENL